MTAAALTPCLAVLSVIAWISSGYLIHAASVKPRINVLTERTGIALLLATLGTVSTLLRYNTDSGFSLFPQPIAALIFALTVIALLCVPLIWMVLLVTGRLR